MVKDIEYITDFGPDRSFWSEGNWCHWEKKDIVKVVENIMGIGGLRIYHDRPKKLYRIISKGKEIVSVLADEDNYLSEESVAILRKHGFKLRHDMYRRTLEEYLSEEKSDADRREGKFEDHKREFVDNVMRYGVRERKGLVVNEVL